MDKIKSLIVSIKNEAQSLSETGADLAANMNEIASSINEITATIQSIETQTKRQTASVKGTKWKFPTKCYVDITKPIMLT